MKGKVIKEKGKGKRRGARFNLRYPVVLSTDQVKGREGKTTYNLKALICKKWGWEGFGFWPRGPPRGE